MEDQASRHWPENWDHTARTGPSGRFSRGSENAFCSKLALNEQSHVLCQPRLARSTWPLAGRPCVLPLVSRVTKSKTEEVKKGARDPTCDQRRSWGLSLCLQPGAPGGSSVTTRVYPHACVLLGPRVPEGRALVFLVQCRGWAGPGVPRARSPAASFVLPRGAPAESRGGAHLGPAVDSSTLGGCTPPLGML